MSDAENSKTSQAGSVENKDTDEDFELECSDEEMRMKDGKEWEPSPDEIAELFEKLDKDKVLKLEWTAPGRGPPTPALKPDSQKEVDEKKPDEKVKKDEKSDFDFQEGLANMKLSKCIRPQGSKAGPRGSAKKKTTSLDAILSNMARHRKLDMMDSDDDEDPLP